jgi:porphyrinogen peroxidase
VADLREPRTTVAGVNLVSGFRPELWRQVAPKETPRGLEGFNRTLVGADGYSMPATQHDLVLWFAGSAYDVVFDEARLAIRSLEAVASVAEEVSGWPYHHDRDLTGFLDGTENPPITEAPGVAIIPDGRPGAGGSVLLLQKWHHEVGEWDSLSERAQEKVIGRTKADSVELDPSPSDSHVKLTDQDRFGKIFRRNVPFGDVTVHGTVFIGFCADRAPLQRMLESMAGVSTGVRDALTRYTRPLTGGYYFVPSTEAVRRFQSPA